ncbi:MAG: hypothetical protein HYY24_10770 [Verrucomicrobia bacterium]|nr:hypothetical protein [Verrucomicrobiota bacterium]
MAADPPAEDIVLKALGDELKRSLTLHLEDLDTPYFIQYAVDDTVTYRIEATHGALVSSDQDRFRMLYSQVRVGSHELDNSNFAGRGGFGARRGLSASAELPTDDDYLALRHAIWLATDAQYKDAVEALTQKRAYLRDRTIEDRPRDFTQADAVTAIKERVKGSFDRAAWEDYVRRISARFGEFKHLQRSAVNLTAGTEDRYLVNSEGSRLRYGDSGALLRITAETQAEDGQRLSDQLDYVAAKPEELPAVPDVLADVQKLADRLAAAIKAPVLEDYTGPVLLDGVGSAQFFRQLLARGLAGQVDPVGSQRREAPSTENLESRAGKRILPVTFQVYDDPRQDKFQGRVLAGHYLFDDEGIAAQRVELVVDGKLEDMVMSRAPTKLFTKSNGHGRRSGGDSPRAAVGCLYIESTKGLSPDELKKELIDAADAEGLKYGLRITAVQGRAGGGGGPGGGGFRRGGGAGFARSVGDPIAVYKVFVADGHEELVRGCEFSSIDVRTLRRIIAAGNVQSVHNNVGGGSPASSVIAPAVLFEELELTRIKQETEKRPIIEAPHARK